MSRQAWRRQQVSLTLFGHGAAEDHAAIVKDIDGRRLNRLDPEASLLLRKPTGELAHGGGVVLSRSSDDYRVLLRWIAAGAPLGDKDEPTLTDVTIEPSARSLARNAKQQLTVTAHYSDGGTRAVTRLALYESGDPQLATVTRTGRVEVGDHAGDAAILVKYGGHVRVYHTLPDSFRAAALTELPSFQAGQLHRRTSRREMEAVGRDAICGVRRRDVPAPRVARSHRHAANAGRKQKAFLVDKRKPDKRQPPREILDAAAGISPTCGH